MQPHRFACDVKLGPGLDQISHLALAIERVEKIQGETCCFFMCKRNNGGGWQRGRCWRSMGVPLAVLGEDDEGRRDKLLIIWFFLAIFA